MFSDQDPEVTVGNRPNCYCSRYFGTLTLTRENKLTSSVAPCEWICIEIDMAVLNFEGHFPGTYINFCAQEKIIGPQQRLIRVQFTV